MQVLGLESFPQREAVPSFIKRKVGGGGDSQWRKKQQLALAPLLAFLKALHLEDLGLPFGLVGLNLLGLSLLDELPIELVE